MHHKCWRCDAIVRRSQMYTHCKNCGARDVHIIIPVLAILAMIIIVLTLLTK